MALTYTQLKAEIQNYTENDATEFTDSLDTIIQNTELRIYREADLDVFYKSSTSSFTNGDRYLAKPSDFVVDRFLSWQDASGDEHILITKDQSFIETFWPDPTTTGSPRFYAEWDHDTFVIAPTPDSNYTVTLGYTYRPASIVSAGSSWLGNNAQDVLLYGCLIESYRFMKKGGDPDLVEFKEAYADAMKGLRMEEESRQRREEYRHGVRR